MSLSRAAAETLSHLRDPADLQWYVVPLLVIAVYVYAVEVERRNWNAVFAGLAFFGMDWLNEIANALVLHFTQRAPLWAVPGRSAYVILVGLNAEICFFFAIGGVILAKMLPADPDARILGLPNRLFVAVVNSAFCTFVEVLLNGADLLVWEYRYWSTPHVWSIFLGGYLHFHLVAFWVHDMAGVRRKAAVVAAIWAPAIASLLVFGVWLRWI